MECFPRELKTYETADGRQPFWEWLDGISDKKTKGRIYNRVDKVRKGLMGDYKVVGDGVLELREHHGSGYRIYCTEDGDSDVVLLWGGDKDGQQDDIKRAKEYWDDYRRRPDA